MHILITGAAGFIGSQLASALLQQGHRVTGTDNINTYYAQRLKYARLERLGIDHAADIPMGGEAKATGEGDFRFVRLDLADREGMARLFDEGNFDVVVNLGGQAGVRYSIENPFAYAEANLMGFLNVLEGCRRHPVRHLLYASSSSVYGQADKVPYAESDFTDAPVSLYAATKKSDELMAYAYSKLYGIPATGLRFFTVYGPWGRPDMAPFLFLRNILEGKPIRVFNHGKLSRDFTFIDDIVRGVMLLLPHSPESQVPHRVYNIGNSRPVELMDFIHVIERTAGREAVMRFEEMQPGDVYCTFADTTRLHRDFGYTPQVGIEEGIGRFYTWYKTYGHLADE